MRVAVTGANGFVGRHVLRQVTLAGWPCVGIVRSDAAAEQVARAGGQPQVLDLADPDALARSLDGCTAVVHLAQIGAERRGATYQDVNIGFTQQVSRAARRAGVERIVFFSGLGVARYGMTRRCTNPYFLSKLASEAILMRSEMETIVFRPSFVVGPGDAFVPAVVRDLAQGAIEVPGDGSYRMQPIAAGDVAEIVLAALRRPGRAFPTVFDLVGPEAISYSRLLERLVDAARSNGRSVALRVLPLAVDEAERRARSGGCRGMLPDELDCLLCDQVSDAAPLAELLARPLTPLDTALAVAVRALAPA